MVREQHSESGSGAVATTAAKDDSSGTNVQNSPDSNVKILQEFKKSLVAEQKSAEQRITEINSKLDSIKKQIDEERAQLDDLRAKLKQVNQEKDIEHPRFLELKNSLIEAKNQMKTIDEKIGPAAALKSRKERYDMDNLTRTLEQIERDLQIKKLSKEEERKLVAKSKEIATKLHALKVINKKEDRYRVISSQYDGLKEKVRSLFKKKEELGSKIGRLKESLDELLNSRESLYEERRKMIRISRESRAKLEMVETQLNAIEFKKSRMQAAEHRQRRQKESEERRIARHEAMQEKAKRDKEYQDRWNTLKEAALKKMSSGEKLTFDEMKLIFGDGTGSD